MVGGTSHRNRIIEISVLGQIVVMFENVFSDGASRGATQQLSSTAGFARLSGLHCSHTTSGARGPENVMRPYT